MSHMMYIYIIYIYKCTYNCAHIYIYTYIHIYISIARKLGQQFITTHCHTLQHTPNLKKTMASLTIKYTIDTLWGGYD